MGRRTKRRSKKRSLPRGAQGSATRPSHDLNVPLPKTGRDAASRRSAARERRALLGRLRSTGYSVVAFSHTVFGRPDRERDEATTVMPPGFVSPVESVVDGEGEGKKRRRSVGGEGGMTVLRRLNVVVEELSDLAHFTSAGAPSTSSGKRGDSDVLSSYDLIAVSARNDATFTSACETAAAADILILDYTAGRGGVQLPFRLRSRDVRAAAERGSAFEIPYGPAILDPTKRKALVRTCAELRTATLGVRDLRVVLSSGAREVEGKDAGGMALRSPGDLTNVLRTVLGFDDRTAGDAVGAAAARAVARGRDWRAGKVHGRSEGVCARVTVEEGVDESTGTAPIVGNLREQLKRGTLNANTKTRTKAGNDAGKENKADESLLIKEGIEDENDAHEEDRFEDGFITLS